MSKKYRKDELLSITVEQFMDVVGTVANQKKNGVFCNTCGGNDFGLPALVESRLVSNPSASVEYFSFCCVACGETKFYNAQMLAGSILK